MFLSSEFGVMIATAYVSLISGGGIVVACISSSRLLDLGVVIVAILCLV